MTTITQPSPTLSDTASGTETADAVTAPTARRNLGFITSEPNTGLAAQGGITSANEQERLGAAPRRLGFITQEPGSSRLSASGGIPSPITTEESRRQGGGITGGMVGTLQGSTSVGVGVSSITPLPGTVVPTSTTERRLRAEAGVPEPIRRLRAEDGIPSPRE